MPLRSKGTARRPGAARVATPTLARWSSTTCASRDEHLGVRVVEVPLILVERRPHPAPELQDPQKLRGRCRGRPRAASARTRRARSGPGTCGRALRCFPGPRVLARGVVEDDVNAQRHAGSVQVGGQRAQVVHRAQRRLDGAVVGHRVAAVVGRRARGQQRHQVRVGDAQLAHVRQPLTHAGQRAGEAVSVADIADRLLALQPVGGDLALVVEPAQPSIGGRPCAVRGRRVEQRRGNCAGKRGSSPYSATSRSRSSVKNRSSRVRNSASPSIRARTSAYSARTSGRIAKTFCVTRRGMAGSSRAASRRGPAGRSRAG